MKNLNFVVNLDSQFGPCGKRLACGHTAAIQTQIGDTVAGLAASVIADLPDWNWWGYSAKYTAVSLLDYTLTWLFAGLVIAKVIHHVEEASSHTGEPKASTLERSLRIRPASPISSVRA